MDIDRDFRSAQGKLRKGARINTAKPELTFIPHPDIPGRNVQGHIMPAQNRDIDIPPDCTGNTLARIREIFLSSTSEVEIIRLKKRVLKWTACKDGKYALPALHLALQYFIGKPATDSNINIRKATVTMTADEAKEKLNQLGYDV